MSTQSEHARARMKVRTAVRACPCSVFTIEEGVHMYVVVKVRRLSAVAVDAVRRLCSLVAPDYARTSCQYTNTDLRTRRPIASAGNDIFI